MLGFAQSFSHFRHRDRKINFPERKVSEIRRYLEKKEKIKILKHLKLIEIEIRPQFGPLP